MPEHELAELLAEITRRIRAVSDPEQIILFGSYARGEAGPDSDIDLLVIDGTTQSTRQASTQLRRELRGLPAAIDVIVATPPQVAAYGKQISMIYHPALREGKVLYAR